MLKTTTFFSSFFFSPLMIIMIIISTVAAATVTAYVPLASGCAKDLISMSPAMRLRLSLSAGTISISQWIF